MRNVTVLIMEDQLAEASSLKQMLLELNYQVLVTASLSEGLECIFIHKPDICIVDIYINGKPDGIVFGMEINKQKDKTPFIYVTGANDLSTFKVAKTTNPNSYIIKPYNKLELQYTIELLLEKRVSNESMAAGLLETQLLSSSLLVKRGNLLFSVKLDDIRYIEVDGKYSKIVCYDQKFVVQQPLSELQACLPANQFFRVHRNYVINYKEVIKIDTQKNEIYFKEGSTLFYSRRYFEKFFSMFKLIK